MSRAPLDWTNITVNEMPAEAKELFKDFETAKECFEDYWQSKAPAGKKVIFSYRNGNNGLGVGMALTNGVKSVGLPHWVK